MHVVLLCATKRGYQVAEELFALGQGHDFTLFSFRETAWEPPFLDDIRALAKANGHQFLEARNVAKGAAGEFWLRNPVDLILMVNWRYIVPVEVYSRARCGCFVFHDSLLPKYRGFSPTVWAMINGESETGVTLFQIAEDFDTGDIVDQARVPIGPTDTIAKVVADVSREYIEVVKRNFAKLLDGTVTCFPQNHEDATYTCKWTPADARIDWRRCARDIYNLIRATTRPYPGAFTYWQGRKLTIWEAELDASARKYVSNAPGRVVDSHTDGSASVLTGDGAILVKTGQLEGEGRVDSASLLALPVNDTGRWRRMMAPISVVIPVYRSENSIPLLVKELAAELPKITDRYEVILVEDDGGDGSWTVIEQLSAEYEFVRGYKLMRNFGQHNALLCGIRAAKGDLIVTMDDDLQHPTKHIRELVEKLAEGYDVVYGAPTNLRHGPLRNIASQTTKVVLGGVMGADTARNVSAFRVFRARLRDGFAHFRGPLVNIDVLLTWSTNSFVAIHVPHARRTIGKSNYTFGKLVTHAFNMMTGFSTLPLRLASALGLVMTAFGSVILVYIVLSQLFAFRFEVPGFTFTASLVSIFAGVQMFALGIIGEYLARMYLRIMDRPAYVVRQVTGEVVEGSE